MRRSEFSAVCAHVFGPALAATYTRELILPALDGRTAETALAEGEDVRRVWNALCDAMEIPDARRWEIPPDQRRR